VGVDNSIRENYESIRQSSLDGFTSMLDVLHPTKERWQAGKLC
jgi:hypothetical protein